MTTSLRIEKTYPHPRARVWRALVDPELLARWLMPNDFAPRVGHRFTFRTEPGPGFDGIVRCEVLASLDDRADANTTACMSRSQRFWEGCLRVLPGRSGR